jgi:acetyl esterase/lipase
MSPDTHQQDHIAKRRVVYSIAGAPAASVRRDHEYRVVDAGALTMDVYYPPGSTTGALPAVLFVTGFRDSGAERMVGCKLKEMGSYVSWAELATTCGLVAITYANAEPAADAHNVLNHVRQNAAALGIDENRVGLWACSGNVPTALSLLMRHGCNDLKCAVLYYGYTLDDDGSSRVADAARQFGFVNPSAGKSVADLPPGLPLFVARAGQDQMPGLNAALDDFVLKALMHNLPLTVVNHPVGPHAFDLFHDSEISREIIRRTLEFMQFHLTTPLGTQGG